MILFSLDGTPVEELSKGSIKKVRICCEDCEKIFDTDYRNIIGSKGKYCQKCCHAHKKKPYLTKEVKIQKSKKLKKSLKNRTFSEHTKRKISKSKRKDFNYYYQILKEHPKLIFENERIYFKCSICLEIFEVTIEQRNELVRWSKQKKFNNVFHSKQCKKKFIIEDRKNTLFKKGQKVNFEPWNKGLSISKEIKEKISKGFKKNLDSHKLKMRESAIKRLEKKKENGEILDFPNRGRNEIECLKILQENSQYEIILNSKQFGFFPDGYIKELNLVIEYDEPHHYRYNQNGNLILRNQDKERERQLRRFLGCSFLRIKDSEWKEDSKQIIDNFKNLISTERIN